MCQVHQLLLISLLVMLCSLIVLLLNSQTTSIISIFKEWLRGKLHFRSRSVGFSTMIFFSILEGPGGNNFLKDSHLINILSNMKIINQTSFFCNWLQVINLLFHICAPYFGNPAPWFLQIFLTPFYPNFLHPYHINNLSSPWVTLLISLCLDSLLLLAPS